jgi:hypothetical protein
MASGIRSGLVSEIFREVDEELRREGLERLWKKYGRYVIILAVLAVFGTAGFVTWRQYKKQQADADSIRYASALDLAEKSKFAEAADAFGLIAKETAGGRALLARFEQATLRAKAGDEANAIASWKAIASDTALDLVYRDLARILAASHEISHGEAKSALAEIEPLTREGNPWHAVAIELTGAAQLQSGDKAAARDSFKRLSDDSTAPRDARTRAAELVAALRD